MKHDYTHMKTPISISENYVCVCVCVCVCVWVGVCNCVCIRVRTRLSLHGWDEALDRGPMDTLASLSILKLLCKTVFADRKCPVELCNETIPSGHALNDHFLTQHTDLSMDIDSLFDTIRLCSEELFTIGLKLSKFV